MISRRPSRPLAAMLPLSLAVAMATGACAAGTPPGSAGAASPPHVVAPSDSPVRPSPAEPTASAAAASTSPDPSPAAASGAAMPELTQPWATATLTDVETGASFRIADLAGRTVFVEAMAIWCSNCRRQQGEFRSALERLDPDHVAYVVLTIDPGETAEALARYKADQGFQGRYAVAGREVSAALEAEFGATVLNPPSVPLILVRPDGTVTFQPGPHSADDIVALVNG
jgi:hypothetical protein